MNAKVVAFLLAALISACASGGGNMPEKPKLVWNTLDGNPPLIIAHRGASGYRPEHTLEAYKLAIEMGADVIEPDLVLTKDGALVARHDRYLSTTTDVADHAEFASRKKPNADANGGRRIDWWVEDFTLAEIKTLRARQPYEGRSKEFDGRFEIPTFTEILLIAHAGAAAARRPVGVYPETKHPGYFASIGLDFEAPLLAALAGFDAGPVFIQSFEPDILKRLRGKTNARLVQLVFEETPGAGPNISLPEIAAYADGVGPAKGLILNNAGELTDFVADAHAAGLLVHPWTFRNDDPNPSIDKLSEKPAGFSAIGQPGANQDAPGAAQANAYLEFLSFYGQGVDGLFTDHPDIASGVRASFGESK